jgi:Family of unknown function (DUF5995)
VDRIDDVISWSRVNASRLGYFAALYKRVTRAIGTAADRGLFTDPARMQRFDATFANRYFAALNGYFHPAANPPPSHCWRVAFEAAEKPTRAIVLHMLTGMNAHIELDLGIAAWETAKPAPLESLHADFDTVNAVLAQQVESVLEEIDEISPVLADIYDVLRKDEIHVIDDGLVGFRDSAWRFACVLSAEPGFLDTPTIGMRDVATAAFGALILNPPPALAAVVNGIIARESTDVVRNIDELAGIADQDIVKATADR